ncbi:hypothetical protein HDF17_003364 [Granulicella arctica]|uniref:Integrase catalytic domain-containing protein n=1 Tax=Granulicella arctica TaxID=940613 RepID=A0A7Y9PJS3_9BACT|nr:hypothetical protein [Granulicella arctica]
MDGAYFPHKWKQALRHRYFTGAAVKRFFCDTRQPLQNYLSDFIAAYNFARSLMTLHGFMPYEDLCNPWTQTPDRFTLNPILQYGRTKHLVNIPALPNKKE